MERIIKWQNPVGMTCAVIVCLVLWLGGMRCPEAHAATWTAIDDGGLATSANNPQQPAVAGYNNALYTAWIEQGTGSLMIKKYDGSSWSNAGMSGATLATPVYNVQPSLASYNGYLYAAYVDFSSVWGNSRVHIKRFDGTTWSDYNNNNYNIIIDPIGQCPETLPHCNDYPGANINHQFNASAVSPTLFPANGKLYAAWLEWPNGIGHYNVRVAVLDTSLSADWQIMDGGGNTGLNYDATKDAVQSVSPVLAWYNGKLYVGWDEINVRSEFRVKEYTPATATWAFVDGGLATGLNYDPTAPIDPIYRDARNPFLVTFNNMLYAVWSEGTYNDPDWGPMDQIRFKKFNGSVWNTDGSSNGGSALNYAQANPAVEPAGVVYNNQLKLIWKETTLNDPWPTQIRAATYDGVTRTFTDSTGDTGINSSSAVSADQPRLAELNGFLYAVWREPASGSPQLRAKKLSLPPYVTSVAVPAAGLYKSGNSLDFMITFNKAVTVTGAPYLPITLDTGGTVNAAYVSDSGSTSLLFRYTVASAVADPDGIAVGSAVAANGGTLRDADADNADLTLNAVPSTSAVLVDGIAPTATISYSPTGPYKAGDTVTITAAFSEAMAVSPPPRLAISGANTLAATEMNRDSATHYSFSHMVGTGNGSATVTLSTGTDLAGNLLVPTPASGGSFSVVPIPTLTVTISGTGSVNSQNGSGTNYACSSGTCSPVIFGYNDTVTLTATGSNSTFSAWSGAVSGNSNPYTTLLMDGDKVVTATFIPDPARVMIDGSSTAYYSIGAALDGCTLDTTVRALSAPVFSETITMTTNHTLKLRGGFTDAGFTDIGQTGYSIISGSLKIKAGKLIAERVKVKLP